MVDNVTVRYSQLQSDSFLNGAMKYFLISTILYRSGSDEFFIG